MATVFWMFLILYPFVVCSQSGDDGESIDSECWSLMQSDQSKLVCVLKEDDLDICEKFARLCPEMEPSCTNATMENNTFIFEGLGPVGIYKLHIYLKGGRLQTQKIDLPKIVNITTPEIENATYKLDEAIIQIGYEHFYVTQPHFQVEFWGNNSSIKEQVIVAYQQMSIGGDKLRDSGIYSVRVRAKPVDYFDGPWTKWSRVKSFKVDHVKIWVPSVLYKLLPVPIVVTVIAFLIYRWKNEIQTCIFPDVPGPKDTLAQIHRQKHLPVSFSPEIFKDFKIYPVVYTEEKKFTPEFGDDQSDTTESCDEVVALKSSRPTSTFEKQDDDEDQSLESETSQLKLLDESASAEDVHNNPGCKNVTALQRHSNDETYVTMSSLYKTQ
ncbi:interleukin-7 receptor subunit alpha [Tachysurus fulvidraco]|uniref:interleukin-7 receptor subunit alpha n=1 Tax=Tachysurus fulvidraco TaxID=1234273 RepID=UPI001FEF5F24|nr:interleukin-7 receptor subunit alpha [Tachysurus fulvidraco]